MKIEWKKIWGAIVKIAKATWRPIAAILVKEAKKEINENKKNAKNNDIS